MSLTAEPLGHPRVNRCLDEQVCAAQALFAAGGSLGPHPTVRISSSLRTGYAPGEPAETGRSPAAAQRAAAVDRDSRPAATGGGEVTRPPLCRACRDHCDRHRASHGQDHAGRRIYLRHARHGYDHSCRNRDPGKRPVAGSESACSNPDTRSSWAAPSNSSRSRRRYSNSAACRRHRRSVRSL